MWLLIVGLFMQAGVLLSIVSVLLAGYMQNPVEVCNGLNGTGAERCVLYIGRGVHSDENKARALVTFKPNVFQWNGFLSIISGIPGHESFGETYPFLDSIASRVDNVVYLGPHSLLDYLSSSNNLVGFTFFDGKDRGEKDINKNDRYVFETFLKLMTPNYNSGSLFGKTLFILHLSSVSQNREKSKFLKTYSHDIYSSEIYVNKYVILIEKMMERFYKDTKTTYLATPDWIYENPKRSELIAWGHGVSSGYKPPVRLEDVCPLIASLLGISVPLKSLGILPDKFLKFSDRERSMALACNAIQLHQITVPSLIIEKDKAVKEIQQLLDAGSYKDCDKISKKLIRDSKFKIHTSLGVFHTPIMYLVLIALIVWIIVILSEIAASGEEDMMPSRGAKLFLISAFVLVVLTLNGIIMFIAPDQIFKYAVFYHLPIVPSFIVLNRYRLIWHWCRNKANAYLLLKVPLVLVMTELLVGSFKDEFWITIVVSLLGLLPLLPRFQKIPYIYALGWGLTSFALVMTVFGLPQVVKDKHAVESVNLSGTIWMCLGGSSLIVLKGKMNLLIAIVLILYLVCATAISSISILFHPLQEAAKTAAWCLLSSVLCPLLGGRSFQDRLIHMTLGFVVPLLLTSKHIQPLSFAFLTIYVFLWAYLERSFGDKCNQQLNYLQKGFLLYYFCIIAYFAIGKVNPGNSYDRSILKTFSQQFDLPKYYFLMSLRYIVVLTSIFMLYLSLIKWKYPSDISFLYTYLFAELVCLRYFIQSFFFGDNIATEIFNHLFINIFTILIMVAYSLGSIYSVPLVKTEDKLTREPAEGNTVPSQ